MKKLLYLFVLALSLSSCFGIMVDPTSKSIMLFHNDTDYILEFSTVGISPIKPFHDTPPTPTTFKIQPNDTLIYGIIFDKIIKSAKRKLEYVLKHGYANITVRKTNEKGDYIGDIIIYEPPMYNDDSNDNHYFNINSWEIMKV